MSHAIALIRRDAAAAGFRLLVLAALLPSAGCSHFTNLDTADRLRQGYTLVLPGIEGASFFNSNLAQGLVDGGVETAVEVHDWTTGHFVLFLYHLQNAERNQQQAAELAAKIVDYQDRYPGRPVHLVGHSGGAGIIVLTLEALPQNRKVTSAILLAAAISPDHHLGEALAKTEAGIWNYYSPLDAPLLIAGTTLAGTIDRAHRPAAGAFGFNVPDNLSPVSAELYRSKLHQVPFDASMVRSGNLGATWIPFSRDHLAPILRMERELGFGIQDSGDSQIPLKSDP